LVLTGAERLVTFLRAATAAGAVCGLCGQLGL